MRVKHFRCFHDKETDVYNLQQNTFDIEIEISNISRGDGTLLANEIQALIEKYKEENGL